MCEIYELDDYRPQVNLTVECDDCNWIWMAILPQTAKRKRLECPSCHTEYEVREWTVAPAI